MTDLDTFRAETRAWLEANCPAEMRTPMQGDEDNFWGGRNAKFASEAQKVWFERMRDKGWTPHGTLIRARDIAKRNGLHHVYVGNVRDLDRSSTLCPCCGQVLIGRSGYTLSTWNLDAAGACTNCRTPLAGVFEAQPGDWGSRRQPVRLRDYAVA